MGVADGQQIDISVLRKVRYYLGIDGVGKVERGSDFPFKPQISFDWKIR